MQNLQTTVSDCDFECFATNFQTRQSRCCERLGDGVIARITGAPDIHSDHWMWENPVSHLPELQLLGRREVREAALLEDHSHDDAFEFVFVEKGQASWEVGSERFTTVAGNVFHTRPGERHRGSYSVIEPCRFWWLQLVTPGRHERDKPWLGLSKDEAVHLEMALNLLPRVTAVRDEISQVMHRLSLALLRSDTLSRLEQRHLILQFVFSLLQRERSRERQGEHAMLIRMIMETLEKDLTQRYTVEEMAEWINVSPSYFHRMFRRETGLTPMDYVERMRCRVGMPLVGDHLPTDYTDLFGLGLCDQSALRHIISSNHR